MVTNSFVISFPFTLMIGEILLSFSVDGGLKVKYTVCSSPFLAMEKGCVSVSSFHPLPYSNAIVPEMLSWCAFMVTGTFLLDASANINTLSAKLAVASGTISKG